MPSVLKRFRRYRLCNDMDISENILNKCTYPYCKLNKDLKKF